MVDVNKSQSVYKKQFKTLSLVGLALLLIVTVVIIFLAEGKGKKAQTHAAIDMTGVMDESFTDANAESAMTAQQGELESLKDEIKKLSGLMTSLNESKNKEVNELQKKLSDVNQQMVEMKSQKDKKPSEESDIKNPELWHNESGLDSGYRPAVFNAPVETHMTTVSFEDYDKSEVRRSVPYIPSNTTVRAVILGGADADASVGSEEKNNGAMLIKLLDDGKMPNGKSAHLRGCRISAASFGDISSERAYTHLYNLSCAKKGEPIVDRPVVGWVFFGGKVGIKGKVSMRDGQMAKWAFLGKGIESTGQVLGNMQNVTTFGPYGAASFLPSDRVLAAGGASTLAGTGDELSKYYIKRAEQYHPVIQVGAGNEVTVVFKEGFYLEPVEDKRPSSDNRPRMTSNHVSQQSRYENKEELEAEKYSVPPEVLSKINQIQNARTMRKEG